MAYLIQQLGSSGSATVRLYKRSSLRIGRGTNNVLRLDDPGVELEHAEILQDSSGFLLRDLSNLGATWVNERRLQGDHRLASGDRITIATLTLEVDVIDPQSPLVVTVSRLEERIAEPPTTALRNIRELMAAEDLDRDTTFSEATMPTMLSRDLLAMAERERAREEAAEATAARDREPTTDLAAAAATEPTSAGVPPPDAPPAPAAADVPEVAAIDYVRSYRLQRGLLRTGVLAVVCSLIAAGAIYSLVRADRWQAFSPGDLADAHRQIGDRCQACHTGWERVEDRACSECHQNVGDHQPSQAKITPPPACTECHREHRGGDALRLAEVVSCVDCHGRLETQAAETRFVVRITEFAPDDHPEFRLAVERDGASERVALTEPAARSSDPGGVKGFDHDWHLNRLPAHVDQLECESCHHRGDDGEIEPIRFKESCQECHNLVFDFRFENEEAPHEEPAAILTHLSGRYSLRPEFLRALQGEERRRLTGRGLSRDQQLRELALLNTERLLRNRCLVCHDFTPALGSRMSRRQSLRRNQIEELAVRPTAIRERWLPHADFAHGVHLEIGMACVECHRDAPASQQTSDVLVPGIGVCFGCHRTAAGGEDALDRLGRTTCITCHGYHPGFNEEIRPSSSLLETSAP